MAGLGSVLDVLGAGWASKAGQDGKKVEKGGGRSPSRGGLGNPLDTKIDPRTKEIEEKTSEAGKLKISIWTRKTRVQMDLGGDMECQI